MELGQKNLCPVCGKDKLTDKSADPKNDHQVPSSGFSKEILAKIDEFLKAHPTDWNDEFDDFFDRQFSTANYRDTVSICRHRVELFADIRAMLKDARKLSADLMLRVMDEIPKKYPEIDENEARALAREFFKGCKPIQSLALKNTVPGTKNRQEELDPDERNIVNLRNRFMDLARTVFGKDFHDYDQHMEVSFADFGCSRDDQSYFYKVLVSAFEIPIRYLPSLGLQRHDEDTLLDAFAIVLAKSYPSLVTGKNSYDKITGMGRYIADKYRTLARTGRKKLT